MTFSPHQQALFYKYEPGRECSFVCRNADHLENIYKYLGVIMTEKLNSQ